MQCEGVPVLPSMDKLRPTSSAELRAYQLLNRVPGRTKKKSHLSNNSNKASWTRIVVSEHEMSQISRRDWWNHAFPEK